ncbi:MAG TPA: tetratricopeptide repeat protein, partial [Thermoanaerobaculia bacterium]
AEDIAARADLGKGDYPAAEAAARKVLETAKGKERVRGCLVLGRIAVMRNDLAGARAFSEKAEELSGGDKLPQSGMHMLRGDVLARSGRPVEAEKEFLEELRLYPDRVDARVSLSALYATVNRRQDARRVIIDLVSRQPTPESFLLGMKTFRSTEDPEGEVQLRREARRLFPKDPRFAAAATSSSAGGPRSR